MPNPTEPINQLVFIVVNERQGEELMQALNRERFYFTRIDSSGMVFQEATVCLMVGLNNNRFNALLGLVNRYCQPHEEYVPVQFSPPAGFPPMSMIEAKTGGALIYLVDVDRFEQF